MKSYPVRKHPRLKEYDYSENGAYFLTLCAKDKKHILSDITVGRAALSPPQVQLTEIGKVIEKYILRIPEVYPGISVDCYVIMPNHVHLLLNYSDTEPEDGGLRAARPTVTTVVCTLKRMVSREIGRSIWQTSFYDHVIRGKEDYLETWKYIEDNPAKWAERMN